MFMLMTMNWGPLVTLNIYQTIFGGKLEACTSSISFFQYKNISKRPPIFNKPSLVTRQ